MSKTRRFLVVVTAAVLAGGSVYAEDWKVGEKWVYQHEGPRPYSDPSSTVEGDRAMEVTALQGRGAQQRYLLKNMWGAADATPTTVHIDAKNMIHKIEIESVAVMLFDPPVPVFWQLKVGEEKTLKTKMELGGFVIPIEYVAKRLKDETLTVPAGEFKNCRHMQIVGTTQSDMFPTSKSKVDHWYHPRVKNLVKETVITNYEGDNSYTATSVLKSHTKKD